MPKRCLLYALAVPSLLAALAVAAHAEASKEYIANLRELNGSGISGTAHITVVGDQITVDLVEAGLDPAIPYEQYLRGFATAPQRWPSLCPPPSADANDDGTISFWEGYPYYGPLLKHLFNSSGGFGTASLDGTLSYTSTWTVLDWHLVPPLQSCTIVLQEPDLSGLEAGLPVACGEISVLVPGKGRR